MIDFTGQKELVVLGALVWVCCALLSFVNGFLRGLHTWQWLALSAAFGPLALVTSLFLHGRGPRVSLFAREPAASPAISARPLDPLARPAFGRELADLRRQGRIDEAIEMLLVLVDTVEEKARAQARPVPHWYYEQLANLYHRRRRPKDELKILRRYASKPRIDGKPARRLLQRLERLSRGAEREST
jgi:hypothetical protein